ncbi:MAG TPA: hypothetical protein VFF73_38195 [Planctomycetota bacterium]|nr:hypothetical protein [Planctomycetota bacterium]
MFPSSEHLPPMFVLVFSLAAYLGVKLVGYAAACSFLRRAFPDNNAGAWKAGAVRAGLGVAGGLMYVALWNLILSIIPHQMAGAWLVVVWHLGLFATRTASWWALFALHFPGALRERKRAWVCSLVGALWSHALDLPAWVAFWGSVGWLWSV